MIRPATRFVLHAVAAIVAALAVALAAVAWRLTTGPVSLGFLTPYVADALRESDSPYRVEFSDTVLTWAGRGHPLDIRILDVRAVGPEGAVAATVPEIALRFSVPALLRGIVAPTSLVVIEPRMRVVRGADGDIELGFGEAVDVESEPMELLIADLLAPLDPTRSMGYLRRVSIIDADLTVEDRRLGTSWYVPRATIRFMRDAAGIDATAALDVEIGGHRAEIEARARFDSADGWTTARIEFTDIHPQWLAQGAEFFARLEGVRLPVSGSLDIRLGADGGVSEVGFDINAGVGEVDVGEWFDQSFGVTYAQAKGVYQRGVNRLRLDDAMVDFGGPTLAVQGLIEGTVEAPVIIADATVTDLPVDDLGRYWPESVGTATRRWIVTNLTEGLVRKGRASINIKPGDLKDHRLPDEAIDATIEFSDVTVNYLDPLPKVLGADGIARFSGRAVEITTSGGRLDRLRAGKGLIRIGDIGGANLATIDLAVSGPVEDAMQLIAHPRLGYAKMLGIEPENSGGRGEANLHFAFQIKRKMKLDKVAVTVSARLTEISLSGALGAYDLSRGTLSLTLDRRGVDVAGSVALDDVPATIAWRRNFSSNASFSNRYTLKGRFTDAQRTTLKFPGNQYVAGPIEVEAVVTELPDGRRDWEVEANLGDAEVRVDAIRWSKRAGVGGTLRLEARSMAGMPFVVDSLEVAAGDLFASGSAEFSAGDWAMSRLDLERLEFGDTDIRVTVVPIEKDGYAIDLGGASLDLRPYVEDGVVEANDAPLPTLDLTARVDRLFVREDYPLSAASFATRSRNGLWETISFDGTLAGGERLALRLGPSESGRSLTLSSDDAGDVLRSFNVFDNVIGGKLLLAVELDAGKDGDLAIGELTIDDFTLIRAPTLAKLLSVASFTGVYNLLKGEGLPFTNLIIPFIKSREALDIEEARSYGAALGFTFEGRIDLAEDVIDLNGTLVPAYTLNSIIGKVPILGKILVGPKGGGVFAATYRIIGPLDRPTIIVNPLAAFAPGVLRQLFFIFGAGVGDVETFDPEAPGAAR